jgi:hypothetical protein
MSSLFPYYHLQSKELWTPLQIKDTVPQSAHINLIANWLKN